MQQQEGGRRWRRLTGCRYMPSACWTLKILRACSVKPIALASSQKHLPADRYTSYSDKRRQLTSQRQILCALTCTQACGSLISEQYAHDVRAWCMPRTCDWQLVLLIHYWPRHKSHDPQILCTFPQCQCCRCLRGRSSPETAVLECTQLNLLAVRPSKQQIDMGQISRYLLHILDCSE